MSDHGIGPDTKLNPDGLAEAIFDLRFDHSDSPELVVAKIATMKDVAGWRVERLPSADIPAPLRRSDPNLAFQTLLQVTSPEGYMIRIGENIVSYHVLAPYPGWEKFRIPLIYTVNHICDVIAGAKINRLGIRYLNILSDEEHKISGMPSTNVAMTISGKQINDKLNINYRRDTEDHSILVRLATPEFVQGPKSNFNLMIDLDVFTPENFSAFESNAVMDWAEKGHRYLKDEFFSLIRSDILANLVET